MHRPQFIPRLQHRPAGLREHTLQHHLDLQFSFTTSPHGLSWTSESMSFPYVIYWPVHDDLLFQAASIIRKPLVNDVARPRKLDTVVYFGFDFIILQY